MNWFFRYFSLISIFCSIIAFASCDNNVCKDTVNTPACFQFFLKEGEVPLGYDSVSVLRVRNGVVDTCLKDTPIFVFQLPLSPTDTITKFFITAVGGYSDTVVFLHKNTNEFISAECGARVVSRIDSFYFSKGRFGDSIVIANPIVNGAYNVQNVKIFIQ